jgi:hypothetical protein
MTDSFPKTALLDFFVVGGSVDELFCVLILEPFRILAVLQCPPGLNPECLLAGSSGFSKSSHFGTSAVRLCLALGKEGACRKLKTSLGSAPRADKSTPSEQLQNLGRLCECVTKFCGSQV